MTFEFDSTCNSGTLYNASDIFIECRVQKASALIVLLEKNSKGNKKYFYFYREFIILKTYKLVTNLN